MYILGIFKSHQDIAGFRDRAARAFAKSGCVLEVLDGVANTAGEFHAECVVATGDHWVLWNEGAPPERYPADVVSLVCAASSGAA